METTPEQLSAAHREIRHLQEMIAILRTELEAMRLEKDHAVQQVVADTHIENQQFRDTITALREELEKQRFDTREQVNHTQAAASDEINQLKATVTALRQELEVLHHRGSQGERQRVAGLHDRGHLPHDTGATSSKKTEPHNVG